MKKLVRGLEKFKQGYVAANQDLLEELSHGQKPRVLFITCSDSRVPPNLITQTDIGDLFVIRNAGNIIPPFGAANGGEGGTIEYAINALGIEQVVICGHSHCGAMKGLMKLNQLQEDMPLVYDWLRHAEATRRLVRDNYPHYEGEERVEILVAENVLIQIDNFKTYPVVRSRLAQGKLKIYGWIYHIETGEVLAYDPATRTYIPPQSQLLEDDDATPVPGQYVSTQGPPVACEVPGARRKAAGEEALEARRKAEAAVFAFKGADRIRADIDRLMMRTPRSWTEAEQAMRSLSKLLHEARQMGMTANEAQGYYYRFSEQIPKWHGQVGQPPASIR